MAGILFLRTADLEGISKFYTEQIGMKPWLAQKDVTILSHDNFIVGFVRGDTPETEGMLTFYYPEGSDIDRMYGIVKDRATGAPKENDKYHLYHFFAKDPEGRIMEFQQFLHPVSLLPGGDDLLASRRSVRQYDGRPVSDELFHLVFEACRTSPTSNHSQSYSFVVVRDPEALHKLAAMRAGASAPIGRAPAAVAVVADPAKSGAHQVDGHIAAYHFVLASWVYGLGTCWIGSMDRDDAKELLGIPQDHFIACVTPVGYPAELPASRPRREQGDFVRFL